jgi:hypothetical protein
MIGKMLIQESHDRIYYRRVNNADKGTDANGTGLRPDFDENG